MSNVRRAGVVLCGGRSSRMGSPKHLLELNGRTYLQHCIDALKPAVDELIVSLGRDQEAPAGLDDATKCVRDQSAFSGPLSGIASACDAADAELLVVVSCDAPLLKTRVVDLLLEYLGDHDVSFAEVGGRRHFFPGVFRRSVGSTAKELLKAGEHRVSELIERHSAEIVPEAVVRTVDPELLSFRNVNTPDDQTSLLGMPN